MKTGWVNKNSNEQVPTEVNKDSILDAIWKKMGKIDWECITT